MTHLILPEKKERETLVRSDAGPLVWIHQSQRTSKRENRMQPLSVTPADPYGRPERRVLVCARRYVRVMVPSQVLTFSPLRSSSLNQKLVTALVSV